MVDYELGQPATLLVKIFDEVTKGDNKPMGSAVFEIGDVLGAKGSTKAKKMKDEKGTLFARVEKAKGSGTFKLKMSGIKLKNLDGFFNKSDPYYEIMKKDHGLRGSEWNVVHRSIYIKDDLDPNWPLEDINLGVLCGDDLDEVLVMSVFDHESSGKHELMGKFETTVNGIIQAQKSSAIIQIKKNGKTTGTVVIHVAEVSGVGGDSAPVEEMTSAMHRVAVSPSAPPLLVAPIPGKHTFTEYIAGGCEMNLCVAIDFTGSNGDPRQPGTLHHLYQNGQKNDYEKAISVIGSTLAKYDSDKKFPVLGFGAKYGGQVQHCFQCGPTEEVDGVQGILDAYHHTFKSGLVMSGPTVFTEVIQTAAARALSSQQEAAQRGKQKYTILLILSDGAVSDVGATAQVLDQVDGAPLSVVIVGIGGADFSGMQFLDDQAGDRDIAQFVEFNQHKNNSTGLTSATLDEIPTQLENYFTRNGIKPNPPVYVDEDEIVVEAEEEEIDLTIDFGSDGNNIAVGSESGGVYIPTGAY